MAIRIVERAMHVNELIMIMYNSPSSTVYDHFKIVSSHLKKPSSRSRASCITLTT